MPHVGRVNGDEQVDAVELLKHVELRGVFRVRRSGTPSGLPISSGSKLGSRWNFIPGFGKNSVSRSRYSSGIGAVTRLSETNSFTFVLNTGRCSHGPSD